MRGDDIVKSILRFVFEEGHHLMISVFFEQRKKQLTRQAIILYWVPFERGFSFFLRHSIHFGILAVH